MEEERYQICPNCNALNLDAPNYCGNCGAPLRNDALHLPTYPPRYPPIHSKKDFYNAYAGKLTKGLHTTLIVLCLFSVFLALINVFAGVYLCLLDLAFLIPMAVLMILRKSHIPPILVLIYDAVIMLIGLMRDGFPYGFAAVIVAALVTFFMYRLHQAYCIFEEYGVRPKKKL